MDTEIFNDPAILKNYTYGTHRWRSPEETLKLISPHFEALGITRIADVTGLDTIGIPVCTAMRPNARMLSVTQGKGLNLPLAKASAAMEAIEFYHAENADIPTITTSYRELSRTVLACDPHNLKLHAVSIYHDDLPIQWVEGYDWAQQEVVFVPWEEVRYNGLAENLKKPLFFTTSNGLASGNHFLEAVSHGICEVVERGASSSWNSRLEADRTFIDLDTVDNRPCQELLEKVKHSGITLYAWNQTSSVGIPAFGCILAEYKSQNPLNARGFYTGYGCHLSKEVALIRAITEAAQSRLTFISGARDDMYRSYYSEARESGLHTMWESYFEEAPIVDDYRTLPTLETSSLDGDIEIQLSLLKKSGFDQVIVVDLTKPQFQIPVVRAIIPKMRNAIIEPSDGPVR